jgi:anti-anti-sigma factor
MKIETKDDITIITPEDRLDTTTSPEFEKVLTKQFNDNISTIIIDFSNIEYISSAGLRVLLLGTKAMKKKNGKLCICSLNEQVHEVFDISGLLHIFKPYDNINDALAAQ